MNWGDWDIVTTLAGRYEVTQKIGGGGFAITFLARDIMQPSKPLCVVKQLRPDQTQPRIIECFHKEAAILEKLGEHPQIPRLLAHFQERDNLYIVQEFIEGHDLGQEISPGRRFDEAFVSKLLQEVLEVLSFVHQYEVIHRDIKPQNLMRRREDGKIFLIDFGAVKELGSLIVNSRGELASSAIIGTPGYMPNEQGLGKACLASDVYALGMTAIAALIGIQPCELEENPQTGEVIWLERAQVSQELGGVITKMVRRHFSLRYPCAQDVLQDLNSSNQIQFSISSQPGLLEKNTGQSSQEKTPTPLISQSQGQAKPQPSSTPKSQQSLQSKRSSGFSSKPSSPVTSSPDYSPISSSSKKSPITNSWKRHKVNQESDLVESRFNAAISRRTMLQNFAGEQSVSDGLNTGSSEKSGNGSSIKFSLFNSKTTLKSFNFEVITVNSKGDIIKNQTHSAKYFIEDLGHGIGLEMVEIPEGEFFMGSSVLEEGRDDDESPQHKVNIKPFFMGKFAVTQAQFQEIMGKNPSRFLGEKRPVEKVSWNDAIEFCQKLTEKTGRIYRLPSEAEWEYACRARTTTPFHFGETIITNLANYDGNSTYANAPKGKYRQQTTEVGSFSANAFGLYDMHGNVWEWCEDTRHDRYNGAPDDGSAWTDSNHRYRLLRGGSWYINTVFCRSAYRFDRSPLSTEHDVGFRVVCGVPYLKSFDFEIVTINAKGNIIDTQSSSAKYFTEYLGNGTSLEMIEIPSGEFFMGSPTGEEGQDDDESPQHKVNIKSFFIGKFVITQSQYQEIMGKNPSHFPGEMRPVERISWYDANEFCQKLTEKTGRTYRLPSEAEWEYACRARTSSPFYFGETITTNLANYDGNSTYANGPKSKYRQETTEVGSFPPNAFGLYDMHGNIWEWCEDTRHERYHGAPNTGSAWVESDGDNDNRSRVLRGGSWYINPVFCRSAYRFDRSPASMEYDVGFRVVCSVSSKAFS